MNYLLLILGGGLGVPTASFLAARALVMRHGDQADADAYLKWWRDEHAREQAATNREVYHAFERARQKELTR